MEHVEEERGEAETLFNDNVSYNAMLAKKKAKIHQRFPWRLTDPTLKQEGLSLAEVLEGVQRCGISISAKTLGNFKKAGEVPVPKTRSAGQGKGRIAMYPFETIEMAVAAWKKRHPLKKVG